MLKGEKRCEVDSDGPRMVLSQQRSTLEFIQGHDAILAGDSSILLDASLGKRKAIAVKAMGAHEDYLGLISMGIASLAKTDREIFNYIFAREEKKTPELRNYYALLGTRWEGKSNELVSKAINELASFNNIDKQNWLRCDKIGLYEISG